MAGGELDITADEVWAEIEAALDLPAAYDASWITPAQLAQRSGIDRRTARTMLNEAVEAGEMERQKQRRSSANGLRSVWCYRVVKEPC